jgi:hypothetical protein
MLDDLDAAIKAHETALDDDIVAPSARVEARSPRSRTAGYRFVDVDRKGLSAHYELDGRF